MSKYLQTFFFCLLLMTVIVVVVDISEKPMISSNPTCLPGRSSEIIILGLYPDRCHALSFVCLYFSHFSLPKWRDALKSSPYSVVWGELPAIPEALPDRWFVAFSGMLWFGYQYLVPQANRKWADFEKKYIDVNTAPTANSSTYKQNIYFKDDATTYVGIKGYDTVSRTGNTIFMPVRR